MLLHRGLLGIVGIADGTPVALRGALHRASGLYGLSLIGRTHERCGARYALGCLRGCAAALVGADSALCRGLRLRGLLHHGRHSAHAGGLFRGGGHGGQAVFLRILLLRGIARGPAMAHRGGPPLRGGRWGSNTPGISPQGGHHPGRLLIFYSGIHPGVLVVIPIILIQRSYSFNARGQIDTCSL